MLEDLLNFGGGSGSSKEFGRSSAETNINVTPVYGSVSSLSTTPTWLWPAAAVVGVVLLGLVVWAVVKKL